MKETRFPVRSMLSTVLALGVYCGFAHGQAKSSLPSNGILQEIWTGIRGSKVADLTANGSYKKRAREARILPGFRADALTDNYGARYSTLLLPPETGEYTFWIASDDASELWLSTDEQPGHLEKIASVGGYTGREAWDSVRTQKSKAATLEKGKRYFIRVLHKEGGGDDHLAVAWQGPGLARAILKGEHLRVPELDKKTKALVRKIRDEEENKARLLAKLAATRPEGLHRFANGLGKKEQGQLAQELFSLAGKAERKATPETAARLKAYGRLTARLLPTPETPVENPVLKALLVIEDLYLKTLPVDDLEKTGAHRAATAFGGIPDSATAVEKTIRLSSSDKKHGSEMVSTGLYARPGMPVVITIPKELVGKNLSVQIGHHLNGKEKTKIFDCMPHSSRRFPLSTVSTKAINPHGGLMLVHVPANVGLADAAFRVAGAIEAPYFILGKTTDEEWKTIRNRPAPWGELATDNYILAAHSDALKKLDSPTDLMTWWDGNVTAHDGFYNHVTGKPFRMHTVHYAVRGVSTWPLYETKESVVTLLNLKRMKAYNDGLYLHEHGHHGDSGSMMFGNLGESTPNWAGYYMKATRGDFAWKDTEEAHMLRLFDKNDDLHQGLMQDNWWTTRYTHYWSYPVTSMMVGYVQGFGWEPFKTVVHRFTHGDDPVNQLPIFNGPAHKKKWWTVTKEDRVVLDRAKIDKWLIFLSEEAKHDVRPYFAHFRMGPSPEAAKLIDQMKLPKWDLVYIPTRRIAIGPGQTVTIPSPVQDALTYAGKIELAGIDKPSHGKLTGNDDGTYVYRPEKDFMGKASIPFRVTNKYGNVFQSALDIYVMPEDRNPHLAVGSVEEVTTKGWKAIAFPRAYRQPVVVATIDLKKHPNFVTRIRNVSKSGCEITLQQTKGDPDAGGCRATWGVMEAGEYSGKNVCLPADAGTVEVTPEGLSREANGIVRSYEHHQSLLRATMLGQVMTFNDPRWTSFFWRDERDLLGIRVGCHYGKEKAPRKKETVGYLRLSHGLCQFGDTTLRVSQSGIKSGDLSLRMEYASFNGWGFRSVERYFE